MGTVAARRKSVAAVVRADAGSWVFALAVGLICLFLVAPILVVIITAFNPARFVTFPPQGFTLGWFREIWHNRDILDAAWLSLRVAVITAIVSTIIGTAASLALTRSRLPGIDVLKLLLLSPLLVPGVVFGIALLIFFNRFGMIGTVSAIVAAHICITLPYVVRTVTAGLETMDPAIEDSARSLGASPAVVILTVTLPTIRSSMFAGAIFSFLVSFDEAIVTLFLAGVQGVTLPVFIFQYVQYNNDPLVAAVAALMVLATSAAVVTVIRKVRVV